MKNLKSILEWINLAKSTDAGRYNLCSPWREKDSLVATDGHRMHFQKGLRMISHVEYMDGRDCQPPAWETVLPKEGALKLNLIISALALKRLEAIQKYLASYGKESSAVFHFTSQGIRLVRESAGLNVLLPDCEIEGLPEGGKQVAFNTRYVLDALTPIDCKHNLTPVELVGDGATSPHMFNRMTPLGNVSAVVMPICVDRLDQE